MFLFVAYLLGVLVRLSAPQCVDKLSTLYLVRFRRNKMEWAKDKFPYEENTSLPVSEKDGMGKVPGIMSKLNIAYGQAGNTPSFNYCKWFIGANDPALSRQVQEAEALVRFLSGTTFVLRSLSLLRRVFSSLWLFTEGVSTSACIWAAGDRRNLPCVDSRTIQVSAARRGDKGVELCHLIVNGGTPGEVARDETACVSPSSFLFLGKDDSAGVAQPSPQDDHRRIGKPR